MPPEAAVMGLIAACEGVDANAFTNLSTRSCSTVLQSPKAELASTRAQVRKLVERGFLKSPDAKMPLTTDGEAVYVRVARSFA